MYFIVHFQAHPHFHPIEHIGDSLTEFYATAPPVATHLTLGASLRLVWPTGGQPPFGAEQYQWAPSLFLNYRVPDLGYGMTLRALARYFMSYHAASAGAAKIRKLELYPRVTFDLPERWFIIHQRIHLFTRPPRPPCPVRPTTPAPRCPTVKSPAVMA